MGIPYYTPAPYCVPGLFSILMMCQNKITCTVRKPLWILQSAFHPPVKSTDYTYICKYMCIKLQFIFLCELSFELNESCNPKGYTSSIKAGQGGCRRKIRLKKRKNYDRKRERRVRGRGLRRKGTKTDTEVDKAK